MKPARLVLEDGSVFEGRSFGAEVDAAAEVVFNTSHTGYQEVLSDPSYRLQTVCFSAPILGIYGVAGEADAQSARPQAAAIVCREVSRRASSWRSSEALPAFMARHGIPGIEGVDTRTLVAHLRDEGAKRGVVSCGGLSDAELVERAKAAPRMAGLDLAKVVTTDRAYTWDEGFGPEGVAQSPWVTRAGTALVTSRPPVKQRLPRSHRLAERCLGGIGGAPPKTTPSPGNTPQAHLLAAAQRPLPEQRALVVVVDFGVKYDILRHLAARGVEVLVVPASTPAEAILERGPAGVLLSNGPGDPQAVTYGVDTARALIAREDLPVYGVCLGYQIISLALGARTLKMKFGHRGGNHPVRESDTGRVLITSHNHGFAVDPTSLAGTALEATHESLFDGTLEGIRHRELPVTAVQFHPEAGPGPHEAGSFFDAFASALEGRAAVSKEG